MIKILGVMVKQGYNMTYKGTNETDEVEVIFDPNDKENKKQTVNMLKSIISYIEKGE